LIGEDGEQLGVVPLAKALAVAEEAGLDLVEIAPMANPPVCKVMDYGKYRYQEQKKAQEARLKQKQIQVKEIKLRPGTDENDYQIKLRNPAPFPRRGGQGQSHVALPRAGAVAPEPGHAPAPSVIREDLADIGVVEQMPRLEGRQMVMVIAPKKSK